MHCIYQPAAENKIYIFLFFENCDILFWYVFIFSKKAGIVYE